MHTRHTLILTILFFCVISAASAPRTTPVIRQIDHILVECNDPKSLFAFFSDVLQMPTAWPVSETGGYVTGGVGTGNVILELFRLASTKGSFQSRFSGIAFEPYPLSDAIRRLQSLGIPYSPPEPVVSNLPNGSRGVAWTTVALPSLAKPGMSVFLYEYSPAFLKVDVRRKQMGNRLLLNKGGPLGLQSAAEVVIGTSRLKADTAAWSLMLGKPAQAGRIPAGSGPAIRLAEDSENRIRELVFRVESLAQAKLFLQKSRLAGRDLGNRVYLNPSRIQGLSIAITEK